MQKDICLMLQRKQTMLLLLIIAVMMCLTQSGSFGIGYTTMLVAIMTVGTTSYDEFDNCYPFLMTLPITRRTYVIEKYLFCGLFSLAGWLMTSVLCVINTIVGPDITIEGTTIIDALGFLPILLLIISIMLPIQLKYGAEKSRIVLALIGGAAFLIGVGASKLLGDVEAPAIIQKLDQIGDGAGGAGLILVSCMITAVSIFCSLHIMENKQF